MALSESVRHVGIPAHFLHVWPLQRLREPGYKMLQLNSVQYLVHLFCPNPRLPDIKLKLSSYLERNWTMAACPSGNWRFEVWLLWIQYVVNPGTSSKLSLDNGNAMRCKVIVRLWVSGRSRKVRTFPSLTVVSVNTPPRMRRHRRRAPQLKIPCSAAGHRSRSNRESLEPFN